MKSSRPSPATRHRRPEDRLRRPKTGKKEIYTPMPMARSSASSPTTAPSASAPASPRWPPLALYRLQERLRRRVRDRPQQRRPQSHHEVSRHQYRRRLSRPTAANSPSPQQGRQPRTLHHERGRQRPHRLTHTPGVRELAHMVARAATKSSTPAMTAAAPSSIASPPAAAPAPLSHRPQLQHRAQLVARWQEGRLQPCATAASPSPSSTRQRQRRTVGSGEGPAWGADSRHLIFADGGSLILLDAQTGQKTTRQRPRQNLRAHLVHQGPRRTPFPSPLPFEISDFRFLLKTLLLPAAVSASHLRS